MGKNRFCGRALKPCLLWGEPNFYLEQQSHPSGFFLQMECSFVSIWHFRIEELYILD